MSMVSNELGIFPCIKFKEIQVLVAQAYNPSYSGGRDQEDYGTKTAYTNNSQDPILKKTHHKKRAGGVAQGIGLEFKPQYSQKKKKDLRSRFYH
jgi:hypothetical protein